MCTLTSPAVSGAKTVVMGCIGQEKQEVWTHMWADARLSGTLQLSGPVVEDHCSKLPLFLHLPLSILPLPPEVEAGLDWLCTRFLLCVLPTRDPVLLGVAIWQFMALCACSEGSVCHRFNIAG